MTIPVKVLHVIKGLDLGGTEKVMQLMVSHLDKKKFSPFVYSPSDGPRGIFLRQENIPTYIHKDIFSVLNKIRPQIIHIHRAGWAEPKLMHPIKLFKQQEKNTIVIETNVFGRLDTSFYNNIIDVTLFVSSFCKKRYTEQYKINTDNNRFAILYNPVNCKYICEHTQQPTLKDYSKPIVGRISRSDPGKWSDLALTWLPQVCTEFPHFTYTIVGAIPEAYEFVKKHKLENNVKFIQKLTTEQELTSFLNQISILAHANDSGESFGLVIAEAMAAGLPVISHPSHNLKDNAQIELIEHNQTGFIVNNSREYAEAIIYLLRHPQKAREFGLKGRKKACKFYDANIIATKLMNIYTEQLSKINKYDNRRNLLNTFSETILSFNLNNKQLPELSENKQFLNLKSEQLLKKTLKLNRISQRSELLIFGVGTGLFAEKIITSLKYQNINISIFELNPQRIYGAGKFGYLQDNLSRKNIQLITDNSLRSLFFLFYCFGYNLNNSTVCLTPDLSVHEQNQYKQFLHLLRYSKAIFNDDNLLQKQEKNDLPSATNTQSKLSVLTILTETEPELIDFFKQIPAWVDELVIIWDGIKIPDIAMNINKLCPNKVKQIASPLNGDFSKQRNKALNLCQNDWILALDADERLSPASWQELHKQITYQTNISSTLETNNNNSKQIEGFFLPRTTLYPDSKHFRLGYGLWPDLQLCLYKNTRKVKYINKVHEQLTGLKKTAIIPRAIKTHRSYISKSQEELKNRLALFNNIAQKNIHKLNENFPFLPLSWHELFIQTAENLELIVLPEIDY